MILVAKEFQIKRLKIVKSHKFFFQNSHIYTQKKTHTHLYTHTLLNILYNCSYKKIFLYGKKKLHKKKIKFIQGNLREKVNV